MGKLSNLTTHLRTTLLNTIVTPTTRLIDRIRRRRRHRRDKRAAPPSDHDPPHPDPPSRRRPYLTSSLHSLLTTSRSSLSTLHSQITEIMASTISTFAGTVSQNTTKMFCCFNNAEDDVDAEKVTIVVNTLIPPEIPPDLDKEEFERVFTLFVDDLDISTPTILTLPLEKKWQIYHSSCNNSFQQQQPTTTIQPQQQQLKLTPDYYIDRLRHLQPPTPPHPLLQSLHLSLRTAPNPFILRFLSLKGLELLLDQLTPKTSLEIIKCVKSLMNNSKGRDHFLKNSEKYLKVIVQMVNYDCVKTRTELFEILGAVCLVPGGWRGVWNVTVGGRDDDEYDCEEDIPIITREAFLLSLLHDLSIPPISTMTSSPDSPPPSDYSVPHYKTTLSLKTAILSFLNALLSYGPGTESVEFRMHLRFQLVSMGIGNILKKLKNYNCEALTRHVDFFEGVWREDEQLYNSDEDTPTSRNDQSMLTKTVSKIERKLSHNAIGWKSFLGLLENVGILLRATPTDAPSSTGQLLHLLHLTSTQLLLQPHLQPYDLDQLKLNLEAALDTLAKEENSQELRGQIEMLQKELEKVRVLLRERGDEGERLKREVRNLENTVGGLRGELDSERGKLREMEAMQRNGNNNGGQTTPPSMVISPARRHNKNKIVPPSTGDSNNGCIPPPPPPPPPPPSTIGGAFPPPPPPPLPQNSLQKKSTPTPPHPLKSLNWHKLPSIQNTIWESITDESRHYEKLNLKQIDALFSNTTNNIYGTISNHQKEKATTNQTSTIIDARRAQNLNILLSKLKLPDAEICAVIDDLNEDRISSDMLEQLVRFLPTQEEITLLQDFSEETTLSRADSFLLSLSKISNYSEKLKALLYLKKYNNSLEEILYKLNLTKTALKELNNSQKLKQLLELVLALGNYMNRGNRGNAWGFKLNSLLKLRDTKSGNVSLLHYLVGVVLDDYPDLIEIEKELSNVRSCSRICFKELETEIIHLRNGLTSVGAVFGVGGDVYEGVLGGVKEGESVVGGVKLDIQKTLKYYGEPLTTPPEEFFGIFDEFLAVWGEVVGEVRRGRVKKLEQSAEVVYGTLNRKSQQNGHQKVPPKSVADDSNNGDFDDLISALRAGDVFTTTTTTVTDDSYCQQNNVICNNSKNGKVANGSTPKTNSNPRRNRNKHSVAVDDKRERIH